MRGLVNFAGIVVIGLIAWWFWRSRPKRPIFVFDERPQAHVIQDTDVTLGREDQAGTAELRYHPADRFRCQPHKLCHLLARQRQTERLRYRPAGRQEREEERGHFFRGGFELQVVNQRVGLLQFLVQPAHDPPGNRRIPLHDAQHVMVFDSTRLHGRERHGRVEMAPVIEGVETQKLSRHTQTQYLFPAVGRQRGQLDLAGAQDEEVLARIPFAEQHLVRAEVFLG